MFGVLNIAKPLHCTSHDVVARLRKIFHFKKIGHLGTLDPLAEGVLPVCLGHATRLIEYFPDDKAYRAQITLGVSTKTLDSEGLDSLDSEDKIIARQSAAHLTQADIAQVLQQFTGTFEQQVPLYSAVHHKGQKLYKMARNAATRNSSAETLAVITSELPSRKVTIQMLTLLSLAGERTDHPVLTVDVACSSGTYIRALARDIGQALGCGAYLSGLTRTRHGRFGLGTAISLANLQQDADPTRYLEDPGQYITLPTFVVQDPAVATMLRHGMAISRVQANAPPDFSGGLAYLVLEDRESSEKGSGKNQPLGVVQVTFNQAQPMKVFPPAL